MHHFDAVYRAVGDHRVPDLTDRLMAETADWLFERGRSFLIVRPSRDWRSVAGVWIRAKDRGFRFVAVRLTARYETLVTRVTRRACGNESPFRVCSKAALDEYLSARPEEPWPTDMQGEVEVKTDLLTPEQVVGRIKELL